MERRLVDKDRCARFGGLLLQQFVVAAASVNGGGPNPRGRGFVESGEGGVERRGFLEGLNARMGGKSGLEQRRSRAGKAQHDDPGRVGIGGQGSVQERFDVDYRTRVEPRVHAGDPRGLVHADVMPIRLPEVAFGLPGLRPEVFDERLHARDRHGPLKSGQRRQGLVRATSPDGQKGAEYRLGRGKQPRGHEGPVRLLQQIQLVGAEKQMKKCVGWAALGWIEKNHAHCPRKRSAPAAHSVGKVNGLVEMFDPAVFQKTARFPRH